jgi:hypothetical protein
LAAGNEGRGFVKKAVQRKQFSFEKKSQKTFVRFGTGQSLRPRQPSKQKFFGSFFQKRTASLLRWGAKAARFDLEPETARQPAKTTPEPRHRNFESFKEDSFAATLRD